MKKLIAVMLSLLFVLSLTACGNGSTSTGGTTNNDTVSEGNSGAEVSSVEATSSSDEAEWKQFIKEYEAWVDDYIELVKKYEANPTDMSILSDYTEMVSEMVEWTERADEIQSGIEDTAEALEYSSELLRIAEKLTEVAN